MPKPFSPARQRFLIFLLIIAALSGSAHSLARRSVTSGAQPASRLIVLIYGDSGIYAYMGNNINAGKQYSYREFRKFLALKKKDPSLVVIIRASSSCTYRCNVNMLDEMTIAGMKKYQLVDITQPEEDFVNRLKKIS